MVGYSEAVKAKMVRKMLPPGAVSATALAAETGMNQSTLWRWLREARTQGGYGFIESMVRERAVSDAFAMMGITGGSGFQ